MMRVDINTRKNAENSEAVFLRFTNSDGDHFVETEMQPDDAQRIGQMLIMAAAKAEVPGLKIGFNHD